MRETIFNILIVDDTPSNIDLLSAILIKDYGIKAATNGKTAIKIAQLHPKPDLILLDVMMPEMDGYDVCFNLKTNPITRDIPIIFVTAKSDVKDETRGFAMGAVDYIVKPISPPIVLSRVNTHIALHHQKKALEQQVELRTKEIRSNQLEITKCLGRAAEYKDNETGMHIVRMSHYSKVLAEAINADNVWCQLLFEAAPMHDIGKIGVSDDVLKKPGPLDNVEWEEMKKHVEYGIKILGCHKSELIDLAREIITFHHEKWDGSGYPDGTKGENIPISARIVMIADVFDALTSERPYKPAWETDDAFNYLKTESGKHFDPTLVNAFISQRTKILEIKSKFHD